MLEQHPTLKPQGATSPTRIEAAQRRIEAMKLRREGLTYEQIGERLGCSPSRAHAIVAREFARLRAEQNELAADLLRLANDRIEALFAVHWQNALRGDRAAGEMVLKLMDRQARLFGLDAPRKQESRLEVSTMTLEQLQAKARMMGVDISDLEEGR